MKHDFQPLRIKRPRLGAPSDALVWEHEPASTPEL
jgi:hypothetical protein